MLRKSHLTCARLVFWGKAVVEMYFWFVCRKNNVVSDKGSGQLRKKIEAEKQQQIQGTRSGVSSAES